MSDMLIDIQYDPEQNNYIYSFRMSEQKKHDLEKRLQSYGATLEEAIPNYLQAVMNMMCAAPLMKNIMNGSM